MLLDYPAVPVPGVIRLQALQDESFTDGPFRQAILTDHGDAVCVANRKSCAIRRTNLERPGPAAKCTLCPGAGAGPAEVCLDGHHVVCAGTFLSLTNVELDCLAIIQRCVIIATFDFRMVYEKILATIFGG